MAEQLELVGWVYGFRKVAFSHLLMDHCATRLAEAKHATDDLLVNRPLRLAFDTSEAADQFRMLAHDLGATFA